MNAPSPKSYTDLPGFIRDLLAAPPKRGEGLHNWIFRIARQLHWHLPEEQIIQLLHNVLQGAGVKPGEIESAVHNSKPVAWMPGRPKAFVPHKRWPAVNFELLESIRNNGLGVADLQEASPVMIDPATIDTETLIDFLFPGDPLLCCGPAVSRSETKRRSEWHGKLAQLPFIVPSPMLRPTGVTKEGNISARCLDNTGPRRFLIVEFDGGMPDEHAGILLHLAERAPLTLVVHSGGKSLHGWFYCDGCDQETLKSFFSYAVEFGADPATYTACQLVRMPGGLRDNGKRQEVLFLNPKVVA